MNLTQGFNFTIKNKLIYIGLGIVLILTSTQGVARGLAQVDPGWSEPINLSKSGSAIDPSMVIDSDGIYHVVWTDDFAGTVYVTGDGNNWSAPEVVSLPSSDSIPQLFADANGNVHGFWHDSENRLYHSRVRAADFSSPSAWTSPFLLSDSALDFAVALDVNGDIHLGYVRPEEEEGVPAGVYYRRLRDGNLNWYDPSMLYFSHYLRTSELENSNIDVSTGTVNDEVSVYIVWDNNPRGRVYFANSLDGGQTWSNPGEVDKPDDETGTKSASNIRVNSDDQHVLMVWQRRDAGGNCSEYFQWSDDNGGTWSSDQRILEDSMECGQENQLLRNNDGQIILWTIIRDQVNLLGWDHRRWSEPQIQHELSVIEDPETLSVVALGCRQPQMIDNGLAVVGCDLSSGGDIWFANRELIDISDWYAAPSDWSDPEELVSSQNSINSPVLVAGSDELLHLLWSQEASVMGDIGSTSIYYMGWDGERWSQPITFFQASDGNAGQPSAALDDSGRLLVVWSDSQTGDILFSWANANRANRVAEWSEPVSLPISQLVAISPNILVDESGTIIVAYAVPINEGRGIYITRSSDGGETWSSPEQVFDGVRAGWQIVDQPQLTQTTDGNLHALWLRKALSGNNETLGLYYAYLEEDGNSWSEAELVVDGEVNWSQISSDAQGSVYRIWQELINNQTIFRYQRSLDSNEGWSLPESLSSFGESLRSAKLVVDQVGQLHLLQIVQDLSGRLILRHWLWENERWVVDENTELAFASFIDVASMAATVSSAAKLDLVYSTILENDLSEIPQNNLYYTSRSLDLSSTMPAEPTNIPTSVNTPSPSATPGVTPTTIAPTETNEVDVPTETPDLGSVPLPSEDSIQPMILGVGFTVIVLGGIFAGWFLWRWGKMRSNS